MSGPLEPKNAGHIPGGFGGTDRDPRLGGSGAGRQRLTLPIPDKFLEQLAELVTARVLANLDANPSTVASPYLTVAEAADYLRARKQRVYDLLSARRLTRYKDGSRVLISRAELDDYLAVSRSSRVAPTLPPTSQARSRKGLAA
jgi:excisionase family DNA binding protein